MMHVQSGAQVAAFVVKMDTIAVLQTSRKVESELFNSANPKLLSVIAFACAFPVLA